MAQYQTPKCPACGQRHEYWPCPTKPNPNHARTYPSDTTWARLSDWTHAGRIARKEATS